MHRFNRKPETADASLDFSGLPIDKPIALYYRQSSMMQVGNVATSMQRDDLAEDLKRLGYTEEKIMRVDMDEGVSGALPIDKREGMRRIYDLVAERKIGAVACFDEDRLFRDATGIEYAKFVENCRKNRVVVWTPETLYIFHHPAMGRAYIKLFHQKCVAAADALELIKKRLGGARRRLAHEGKHAGQPLPLGYMADISEGKKSPDYAKIVPFPEYAALIRYLFEVFVETNGSPRETYRRLVAEGYRIPPLSECPPPEGYRTNYRDVTAKGVPTVKTIKMIVTNPFYLGDFYVYERGRDESGKLKKPVVVKVLENNHEAIIPRELFFKAFNLVSKQDLDGNPNADYVGVGRTRIPKDAAPRTAERPLCEGKVHVLIEGIWQRAGAWHQVEKSRYNYAFDRKSGIPDAAGWLRQADWFDEAIIHHLRKRILSTLEVVEIKKSLESKEASQAAELRHIERQIKDAEQQLELREAKIARLTNLSLLEKLEAEYTAIQADKERLEQRREQLAQQPDSNLGEIIKQLQRMNKPETMPRADLRGYILTLVDRIEVVSDGAHLGDNITIYWTDGKTSEFYLGHKPGKKGWTFAEIEAIKRGVAEGWTQLELAAACPTRTLREIKKQIDRKIGVGIKIPRVRQGARVQLVGLERGDVTEAEIAKLNDAEHKEVRRLRQLLKIANDETYKTYCMRVLGFVPPPDGKQILVASNEEIRDVRITMPEEVLSSSGVTITEKAINGIIPNNHDKGTCNSTLPNPCRE